MKLCYPSIILFLISIIFIMVYENTFSYILTGVPILHRSSSLIFSRYFISVSLPPWLKRRIAPKRLLQHFLRTNRELDFVQLNKLILINGIGTHLIIKIDMYIIHFLNDCFCHFKVTSSTESPYSLRITQGTRGLSRGIPSYAAPRFTPFTINDRPPFAVSITTPTMSPVRTYSPLPFLGPYSLPE